MANPLLAAYRYVTENFAQINASRRCGCCNCMRIFPAEDVVEWVGLDFSKADDPKALDKQTALCPHCGAEAVLGDKSGYPIHPDFLQQMNQAWFQRTMIRPPKPKS